MIRALDREEIERVLRDGVVGRIGCHADGRTYVVPVSYVYDAGAIYAHSRDGLKVHMMRKDPAVCFEVDHVEDLVNWDSAICWGTFEELHGPEAEHAMERLRCHLQARIPRMAAHGRLAAEETDGYGAPVVFRLNVTETSGREERLYWQLLPLAEPRARPAEAWLTHVQAQQLVGMAVVLDIDDIWTVADKIAEGHPAAEAEASLVYQGTEPDTAHRLVAYLMKLRDMPAPLLVAR